MPLKINFITATNNAEILRANLSRSPCLKEGYSLFVVIDPVNLPRHYNHVLDDLEDARINANGHGEAALYCFVHHDVYLPKTWIEDLEASLALIGDDWAVLGVAGVKLVLKKYKSSFGWVSDRGREWGSPYQLPCEVDTLDEMLLIVRGDLRFDERFPFDFYGADICIQARAQGRKVYAIRSFCEHNSKREIGARTEAFYEAEELFAEKWESRLPIVTTCTTVNKKR